MRHHVATPSEQGVAGGPEEDASGRSEPRADDGDFETSSQDWLILKRGPARMALFRGSPPIEVIRLLHRLNVAVGLVLVGEDAMPPQVEVVCNYVLMAARGRASCAFADAARDLCRAGWTVERDAALPVIVSSGKSDPEDIQRLEA